MKIGITGGIACGKSTVAKLLEQSGVAIIGTDAIVADIYSNDKSVRDELIAHFGSDIVSQDGQIDRNRIAAQVITCDEELQWLEALLHPAAGKIWRKWLAETDSEHTAVEIPLLFEKKLENDFDIILAVIARSERQLARLAERNLSHDQARQWIDKQMPNVEKADRANYVISNDGSFKFLHAQVEHFLQQIKA